MREPIEEKESSPQTSPAEEPRSPEAGETPPNGRRSPPPSVLIRGAAPTALRASAGGNGHGPPGEEPSTSLLPDPKLLEAVERCRMGFEGEDDMRVVYDAYYDRLHGYFRSRRVPEAERSDLVHMTFLRFWEYRTTIRSPERIHGFVYGIARNVFLRWCEKERRSPGGRKRYHPEDDEIPEYLISDVPWPLQSMQQDQDPESKMLDQERKERLIGALKMLPPKTGLVARLRWIDGLRNKEIAEKLRITPNNVGVLLNDATRRLKRIVKDDDPI